MWGRRRQGSVGCRGFPGGWGLELGGVGFGVGGEEGSEAAVVDDEEEEFQDGGEDTWDVAVGEEEGVVEQDVYDDRAKEGEGQGDEAAYEEEEAGDDHDDADEGHPVGTDQDAFEDAGVAGWQPHGKEVQDVVGAEDEEHEAEEEAGD